MTPENGLASTPVAPSAPLGCASKVPEIRGLPVLHALLRPLREPSPSGRFYIALRRYPYLVHVRQSRDATTDLYTSVLNCTKF